MWGDAAERLPHVSQLRGLYARYADAPRFRPATVPATRRYRMDLHPCAKSSPAHRSCIWCSPWRSSTCGVSHEIWRGWAHGGPPECESQTGPSGSVLQFGWAPPCMLPDAPLLQPESAVARRSPNPPPPHTTPAPPPNLPTAHRTHQGVPSTWTSPPPHTPGGPFHLESLFR